MAKLSPKQKRFIEEYLIDLNASAAARRAGYSPRYINSNAQKLLQNTTIQAAIQDQITERSARTQVDQDRVLLEYARIGFSDIRKLFGEDGKMKAIHELDDDTAAIIAAVEVVATDGNPEVVKKVRLWDKTKALQDVAKHIGFFEKDNAQQNGPKTIKVVPYDEGEN